MACLVAVISSFNIEDDNDSEAWRFLSSNVGVARGWVSSAL
jgi:hypothetical protein